VFKLIRKLEPSNLFDGFLFPFKKRFYSNVWLIVYAAAFCATDVPLKAVLHQLLFVPQSVAAKTERRNNAQ
jgi:hypothetical protein